jgi:hypothetical protein
MLSRPPRASMGCRALPLEPRLLGTGPSIGFGESFDRRSQARVRICPSRCQGRANCRLVAPVEDDADIKWECRRVGRYLIGRQIETIGRLQSFSGWARSPTAGQDAWHDCRRHAGQLPPRSRPCGARNCFCTTLGPPPLGPPVPRSTVGAVPCATATSSSDIGSTAMKRTPPTPRDVAYATAAGYGPVDSSPPVGEPKT